MKISDIKYNIGDEVFVAYRFDKISPYIEDRGKIKNIEILVDEEKSISITCLVNDVEYDETRIFDSLKKCSEFVEKMNKELGMKKEDYYDLNDFNNVMGEQND